MPTLLPMPCPSGPVVVSTPLVWPCSGCPGQRLSSWRKRRMSSSGTAGSPAVALASTCFTRKVQHGVEEHRGMAAGEDEAVAVGPLRLGRIVPQHLVEEHIGRRGQGHRRAGWPLLAACTASMERVRIVLIESCSMEGVCSDMISSLWAKQAM